METSQLLLSVVVALFFLGGFASLAILPDWVRTRRQETIQRQIALTDAIDSRLGAIVSPTFKRSLWGPWQIEIAVPFTRPATIGRVLAVAHETLSVAQRMSPSRYRIVLTAQKEPSREDRKSRTRRSAKRWPADSAAAA